MSEEGLPASEVAGTLQISTMVSHLLTLTTVVGMATIGQSLPHNARSANIKRALADVSSTYDYIVIGGGTAGLTVANRLTEDPTSMLTLPLPCRCG